MNILFVTPEDGATYITDTAQWRHHVMMITRLDDQDSINLTCSTWQVCVRANGKMSDYFTCNVGVRQGENLSPLLFAIYLNDFESYLFIKRYFRHICT